jgi:hypothetical protein
VAALEADAVEAACDLRRALASGQGRGCGGRQQRAA